MPLSDLDAAMTYQNPVPDSRHLAIMAARYLLDSVMALPEERYSDAELLSFVMTVKRSTHRLEKSLRPHPVTQLRNTLFAMLSPLPTTDEPVEEAF